MVVPFEQMGIFLVVLILSIVLGSCHRETAETQQVESEKKSKVIENDPPNDQNCVTDTIFDNGDFVKYVWSESGYDVLVSIDNADKLIEIKLDCRYENIIPKLFDRKSGTLCLSRGQGFHYREMIICSRDDDGIQVKMYGSAISTEPNAMDAFVFIEDQKVVLLNRENWSRFYYELPVESRNLDVEIAEVKEDYLVMEFADRSKNEWAIADSLVD